jgi:ASC-1-like (ASCH) protein
MIHELKIDDKQFDAIWAGDKTHEVRVNDRDYKVFDVLKFTKTWKESDSLGTSRCSATIHALITDITLQGTYDLPPHVCCMSIKVFKR